MRFVVGGIAALGVVRFGSAVGIGVREGLIKKRIRRGSNDNLLVGKAAVRYGVFSAVAGLTLMLVMLTVL